MEQFEEVFNFVRASQYIEQYFAYKRLGNMRGMVQARLSYEYYRNQFKNKETFKAFGELEQKLLNDFKGVGKHGKE